ncbi:MAG: ROK family protein [Chitinophagaceae bacterium]
MQLTAGIDIGGTNTVVGLVDEQGRIVFRDKLKTGQYPIVNDLLSAIEGSVNKAAEQIGSFELLGYGIGAPNGNLKTGTIEFAANLPWERNLPLAAMAAEKFRKPCRLTNDANAAALGEKIYGKAKGLSDFIVITLGTGVGAGIVSNGLLLTGFDGSAGELGHTIVVPNGRKHWGTHVAGCLEAYASATGIVLTAIEFLEADERSSLLNRYDKKEITSQVIYECAMAGDQLALKVFRFTAELLGIALANFVLFSAPEAVILFGGVAKGKDLFLSVASAHMDRCLPANWRAKTKLLVSELPEADAAILGAASLLQSH